MAIFVINCSTDVFREGNGRIVVAYFGEGAASEGDTHGAMNMASTMVVNFTSLNDTWLKTGRIMICF